MRAARPLSCWAVGLCLWLSMAGCDYRGDLGEGLSKVFDGFSFVGVQPRSENLPLPIASRKVKLPKHFLVNQKYVFRANAPVEVVEVSTKILPTRLRAVGAKLIAFPKTEDDLAVVSLGTAVWEIRFEQGSHQGRIYNRFNRALYENRHAWPAGSYDDYIVEFTK